MTCMVGTCARPSAFPSSQHHSSSSSSVRKGDVDDARLWEGGTKGSGCARADVTVLQAAHLFSNVSVRVFLWVSACVCG